MSYFYIFLSIILTENSARYLDSDLGWHLFLGKNMVETGRVTQTLDGYSVFSGTKLPNHEWLSDIMLFLIYNKFGYFPLIFLSLIVLALISLIIFKINKINNIKKEITTLSLIILLLALSISFGVRLQIILFLAVAFLMLIPKIINNFSYRLIIYFFLFWVGNNLHGGFAVLAVIPLLLEFNFKKLRKSLTKSGLILTLLSIAITLNPYGFDYWKLAYDYLGNTYYQTHISEWRSAYQFPVLFINLLFPLSLYLFGLTIYGYWKKISLNELFLLIFFLILSIKHVRFFPVFAILITPDFSAALSEIIIVDLKESAKKFVVLATVLLMPIVSLQLFNYRPSQLNDPFQDKELDDAIAVVRDNYSDKETQFLSPYNKGGYILWTNPQLKVFIDGRGPQTKVNNSTLLEEYFGFFSDEQTKISAQLQKYDITLILIEKPVDEVDKVNHLIYKLVVKEDYRPINELEEYLSNNRGDWQKEFENSRFSVYQKI